MVCAALDVSRIFFVYCRNSMKYFSLTYGALEALLPRLFLSHACTLDCF